MTTVLDEMDDDDRSSNLCSPDFETETGEEYGFAYTTRRRYSPRQKTMRDWFKDKRRRMLGAWAEVSYTHHCSIIMDCGRGVADRYMRHDFKKACPMPYDRCSSYADLDDLPF